MLVITTGLFTKWAGQFGRLEGAHGWGEGLGEERGGGCLNLDAVVRRTLVSVVLQNKELLLPSVGEPLHDHGHIFV